MCVALAVCVKVRVSVAVSVAVCVAVCVGLGVVVAVAVFVGVGLGVAVAVAVNVAVGVWLAVAEASAATAPCSEFSAGLSAVLPSPDLPISKARMPIIAIMMTPRSSSGSWLRFCTAAAFWRERVGVPVCAEPFRAVLRGAAVLAFTPCGNLPLSAS